MKFLLDTQVFIWLIRDDQRLGVEAKTQLLKTENEVYISYLSFFEMTIKSSLGKLHFDVSVMKDLGAMGIILLPGDQESLSIYQIYNSDNKDPFDNFLMASALANELTLISSDHKILDTKVTGLRLSNASE